MFALKTSVGRSCWRLALAAAFSVVTLAGIDAARAETRVLKFYNLHTHEKASFSYKRNGRFDSSEMKKLNWFMRDWRKSKAVTMDPQLMDLIWEAYRQSGSHAYINVICGYRSPATNSMLRSRTSGVAKKSQHTLGKALDFFIPDVPLKKLREIGLKMQVGGVGYYPTSGSPFVHFDVGNARHWPRMSRRQLIAVFPKGGTVHVPSDGKPLPGYQQALASYQQRRSAAGLQVANASSRSSGGGKTLLAFLFGGGDDEAADEADAAAAPAPAARATRPAASAPRVQVAAVVPTERPTLPGGVAVAVGDNFDTSAPAPARAEEATKVAALEIARVPLPTFAPARDIPQNPAIMTPTEAVAVASATEPSVETLIADLESEPAAAEGLAYAVPTPSDRPAFDSVLNATTAVKAIAAATPAIAPEADTKAPKAATIEPRDVAAIDDAAKARVAAVLPKARPQSIPKPKAFLTEAAAKPIGLEATGTKPARTVLIDEPVVSSASAATPDYSGKGGRVRGTAAAKNAPAKAIRIDPQEAIASRIRLASLVADDSARAESLASVEPDADRLVGRLPETLFASGFRPAAESGGAADRFSGKAVTFLPLVEIAD